MLALAAATPRPGLGETLRLALWNSDFERRGPGLLLRDILSGKDPQILTALEVLQGLKADVLLLCGFDYDHGQAAARAFAGSLRQSGLDYPYLFALRPNRGLQSGQDLDGDGREGGPGDAQGWGWFSGQSGMLILSRYPIDEKGVTDHSAFLWADLPGALIPAAMPPALRQIRRLSTTGHWQVPLILPGGRALTLLAYHATPPVFDGVDDLNGRRNHDETAFWNALLAGELAIPPPQAPFVLMGISNLDPEKGEGRRGAIRALLQNPALQDPAPRAGSAPPDRRQGGDPAWDTAIVPRLGGLRLALILPDASLEVSGAGVIRPRPGSAPPDPSPREAARVPLRPETRHFPIWVDLHFPR